MCGQGELRHIRKLKPWGLREVLEEKYRFSHREVRCSLGFPCIHGLPATLGRLQPWICNKQGFSTQSQCRTLLEGLTGCTLCGEHVHVYFLLCR